MFTSFSIARLSKAVPGLLLVAIATISPALAEVQSAQAGGFAIKLEVPVMAPPAEVYKTLVERVSEWWHPTHTFSNDSTNLYIEDKAQGCFCERLDKGGSVQHMQVVFAAPGKLLRMQGGLGPLQSLGASGSLAWHLHAEDGGTRLELRYNVAGYLADGLDAWAKPVESVLEEQLGRLKNLIETGKPELPGA
ncbi:MAG: SRPBCC domain-containing protein, partial [Pseudomonadales bacterium]|nr:SRPBCC domain-containing protein [Pseudomonadales bacterium]